MAKFFLAGRLEQLSHTVHLNKLQYFSTQYIHRMPLKNDKTSLANIQLLAEFFFCIKDNGGGVGPPSWVTGTVLSGCSPDSVTTFSVISIHPWDVTITYC